MQQSSILLDDVKLLMVVSSFCSKCHYNNKLLSEVLPMDLDVHEINVADEEQRDLINFLHPMTAPTLYLLNKEKIAYSHEGVLTVDIIKSILVMHRRLKQKTESV